MQYIGKDVLTHGSLLHLDKKLAWEKLRSRAKQGIRKAQKAGIRCVESRDLSLMRQVWYNPDTLCSQLEDNQKLYLAYVNEQLCGGIIVTPVSSNTLFYHYGGTNELGRSIEANSYLFWHVIEQFAGSHFTYLDVGVSFRSALQHYFQKYCTQPYPIIFRPPPPDSRPHLSLSPFMTGDLDFPEQHAVAINSRLSEYFEAEFTYMPAWEFALQSALRAAGADKGATIGVWSSCGLASYVAKLNELFGDRWNFVAEAQASAVNLACHRWGKLLRDVDSLATSSIPLVEDCRDLVPDSNGTFAGTHGRFAVADMTRWFPLQYGAALVGEHFSDQYIWDNFHCLDLAKRNSAREGLQIHWPLRDDYAQRRRKNWKQLAELFDLLGLSYDHAPEPAPVAFLLHGDGPYAAATIRERLAEFGVITEADERDNNIAIPCHQNLGARHIDYIFGAFRGMVNPCYTYVRTDPDAEAK